MADYDPSSMSWLGRLISGQSLGLTNPAPPSGVPLSIDDPMGFAASPTAPIPPPPPAPVPYQGLGQSIDNWMTANPNPPPAPTAAPGAPSPPPQAAPPVRMAANTQSGMASDGSPMQGTQAAAPPVIQAPGEQASAPPALPPQLPGIGQDVGASAGQGYAGAPPPAAPDQAAQSAQLAAKLQALKQSQAVEGPPAPPPTATSDQLGTDPSAPRGIRNNNPLNLTYVSGQPGVVGTDGRFGQYASMTDGIASSVSQLQTYQDRDGLSTPRQMINKWAPGSEKGNDPQAYVAQVAKVSGLDPDAPIDMHDPIQGAKLVAGMSSVENGKPLDPAVALAGAQAAATPRSPGSAPMAAPGGAQGSPSAPPGGPPPGSPPQAPEQQIPTGIPGMGLNMGYQPATPSEKLMALAAGQASGPTASIGAARGIDAMNQLTAQDRENVFKGQQQQAQTAALLARIPLLGAQASAAAQAPGIKIAQLGINQQKADQAGDLGQQNVDAKTQALQLHAQQLAASQSLAQQRLAIQQQRTDTYTNNAEQLNTGMRALGQKTAAESAKAVQGLTTDYAASGEALQKISDLQNLIGQEGITGSTFKEQFQRFAANSLGLDVGVTPSGFSITNKAMSDFNSGQALAAGKGFGGRITQNEFKTLQQGVLSLGTDPQAAQAILGTYQAAAQRRMQIAENWQKMAQSDPQAANSIMTNTAAGGLNGWYQSQLGGQFADRGISSDPNSQTPSQYASPAQSGSDGWTHVAPMAPGGAPIRYRINTN